MLKRRVFLLSTILSQCLILWFCYEFPITNGDPNVGNVISTFIVSSLILAVVVMIMGFGLMIVDKIEQPSDLITANIGYLAFRFKRIYYSELGYFWSFKFKDKIYVYKQGYFHLILLFSVDFSDNITSVAAEVKRNLEYHLKEDIRKKKVNDTYKNWNGFVDVQSERDGKLNDIGIK